MGRSLRDNAFLVAAVALPLVVVAFFLVATAIPRWLVPPPAHDLLLRASGPHDQGRPRVTVEFRVRDGRVEAIVRPAAPQSYPQPAELFLFEHETGNVRKIPFDLPDLGASDAPRTVAIEALAGRRVLAESNAPDGYRFETRSRGGSGIVGDLFGMRSYDSALVLVNRGRAVPVSVPGPYDYRYSTAAVGWVVDDER
jgi:hypothetical protein